MKTYFFALLLLVAFHASAQINIQQVNVKNPAMQTVYIGIENEFSFSIPSDLKLLKLSSTSGEVKLTKDNKFILNINDMNTAGVQFSYILGKNGEQQAAVTDTKIYKIKRVPDVFHLKVGTVTQSGKISMREIKENMYIGLDEQSLNAMLPIEKMSYSIFHLPAKNTNNEPEELTFVANDATSTLALNNLLKKVAIGSKIYFEKIEVILKNGSVHKLEPLSLLVE